MALIGDLVPINQRQVAIGRLLAVGLTGNLVGASFAGVIGDVLGWRGVFAILGLFGLIVAIMAFFAFRNVATAPPAPFNRAAVAGELPQHLRRSARQGLLQRGFPRGDLHPRAVPLCGAPAAADRRDAGLDRRAADRRLRGRRRRLFVRDPGSDRPRAGARPDDHRRRRRGRRARPHRAAFCLVRADRRSMSGSGSASICCTAASRSTSPSSRRPRAARRPRCIPASSISARRSARSSTASASPMAAPEPTLLVGRRGGDGRRSRVREAAAPPAAGTALTARIAQTGLVHRRKNAHH